EELLLVLRVLAVRPMAEDLDGLAEGRRTLLSVLTGVDRKENRRYEYRVGLSLVVVLGFRTQLVVRASEVLREACCPPISEVDRLDRDTEAQPQLGRAVVHIELLQPFGRPSRSLLPSAVGVWRNPGELLPKGVREQSGDRPG